MSRTAAHQGLGVSAGGHEIGSEVTGSRFEVQRFRFRGYVQV